MLGSHWCQSSALHAANWLNSSLTCVHPLLQKASVQTERVAATLNAGQSLVLTVGLTAVLAMAASGGTGAGVTAGDLVSDPTLNPNAQCSALNVSCLLHHACAGCIRSVRCRFGNSRFKGALLFLTGF